MANSDVTYTEVQSFLSESFGTTDAAGSLTQTEVNALANQINAEVNNILNRLGISLPVTHTDALQWLLFTKTIGSAAYVLDSMYALSGDEDNERVKRFWNLYEARLRQLLENGASMFPGIAMQSSPKPQSMPIIYGKNTNDGLKRYLTFRQRAAADQYDNDVALGSIRANWKTALRRV